MDRCIGCNECVEKCPGSALSRNSQGIIRDEKVCTGCSVCVDVCPALAHESVGWEITVEEVMSEIEKDIPFYDQSAGGVTFSGGEPFMQPQFLLELLQQCGIRSIHRAVDTCMYTDIELITQAAEHIDLFLIDLKHMDSSVHKKYTGLGNNRILQNIRSLAEMGAAITFRIPLVDGVNTDSTNLRQSAAFITSLPGVYDVDVLPYHSNASAKYNKLGIVNGGDQLCKPNNDVVLRSINILKDMGLNVQVGG